MNGVSRRRTSGSQSPLNAELAAYGDAFALKQRLKLVEREEGKVGDEDPEDEEAPISPTFIMAGGQEEREPSCTVYAFLGVTAA
jgi:hypothetical protein